MGSKAAKRRDVAIKALAAALEEFYPEHAGDVLCPTCLKRHPATNVDRWLTEAHILPRSAGGSLATILCDRCNGPFGTRRDKWFAEYLRFVGKPNATFFDLKEQKGYFHVGDLRVAGKYGISEQGGIEFMIREDLLAPGIKERIPEQIDETITRALFPPGPLYEHRRTLKLTVPAPPILDNLDSVTLGFLTAAYLLWFRRYGYSWALQKHLDVVREQIMSDTLNVLPRGFSGASVDFKAEHPLLGFGTINGIFALITLIADRVVLFPPFDDPDFYRRIPQTTLQGAKLQVQCTTRADNRVGHETGPHGVLFEDKTCVIPDVFFKGKFPMLSIRASGAAQMLYPISEEEFQRIKQANPDGGLSLTSTRTIPDARTGRDAPRRKK